MAGKLIVGSMPIGNLDDLTLRMVDAFASCDYILSDRPADRAEKVLEKFRIKKKIVLLNSVNSGYADMDQVDRVAEDILNGKTVLLVSSEGQVAISDPGVQFIQKCITDKIPHEVLPGPSAGITAYVASGLSNGRLFIVPSVERERISEVFNMLKDINYSTVVHVWAKDLPEIIEYIDKNYKWTKQSDNTHHSNRIIAVCCDLTMPTENIFMDWAHKIKYNAALKDVNINTRVSLILGEVLHMGECDHIICNMYKDFVPGQSEGLII